MPGAKESFFRPLFDMAKIDTNATVVYGNEIGSDRFVDAGQ